MVCILPPRMVPESADAPEHRLEVATVSKKLGQKLGVIGELN